MKRLILLLCLSICVALFATVTALMRDRLRPQFSTDKSLESAQAQDALPKKHFNQNQLHKLIITDKDDAVYNELLQRNAIQSEIDYESFKLLVVKEDAVGGRAALEAMNVNPGDYQNEITLNGYVIDPSATQPLSKEPPADLKLSRMSEARSRGENPRAGLYIVQFVGPVMDSWLSVLKSTGVDVVSYVSNNAYVVRANDRSAALISRMKDEQSFVQWVGDYHPAFKLAPAVAAARGQGDAALVRATVQVLNSRGSDQVVSDLRGYSREPIIERRVMNYRNITGLFPASQLTELAKNDDIFAIEEAHERVRLDEAQGQIVAGNLSGTSPSGPGYLSWLASKGFNSSQFGSFAVNVADDAYSLTGHPDLPSSRIAFQNNPTSQTGAQGGHGFLNSHIVGGFNSGTGSAVEDASGFNYGLGIAPWARVGVTAIFGNGASTPTAWENTAYGQGARISSNSWGFINLFRYDTNAQEFDRIVRDAQSGAAGNQQLIVVFAAGNGGSGSNTVSSPGTAKNVITVGASENVRQTGTDGCAVANSGANSANDIISFSSRGPVNSAGGDGRVKPDIVAPGTHIEAGVPQSNYDGSSVCNQFFPAGQTLYGWSSGTSHSTPAVAGGAALLYQYFLNSGLAAPSPAMTKAFLANSAAYMNGTGAGGNLPSNSQGMGRMDMGRAFDGAQRLIVDQTQIFGSTGQTFQVTGSVTTTSQPFRVTLAWSDAPGPTTGAPYVNNLDLEVSINGQTYRGNVFSGANSATGGTADPRNNLESVFLPAGTSGSFTVTVRATNIAGDGVPGNSDTTDQDFALVVYNGSSAPSTQPTIGVNPGSLSFTATAGGANPASQTVSITNLGAGTLNWTAADNASWLTVSPTSGVAPSTLTASVNVSGLAAGTYTGTITISATGATNSPVSVPVTLTVNSGGGGGTELIVNGGLESGGAPWFASGSGVSRGTGANAHTGSAYLLLGGLNNATGAAYQQITIPSGTSPSLNFWLNITSSETTTTTQFDRLFIEVRSTSGTLLGTLATFSNLNKVSAANAYTLRGAYSLSSFAGQTVRIQFRYTNDVSLITTYRIDDVSVQ
ncbi:MAG TPA: S8 family serine peptidase [Blastocatellia bacterium]|nr:S8 family serine peptidase [Blastocatellia bacterium]